MSDNEKRQRGEYQRRSGDESSGQLDWQGFGMRARVRGHDVIVVVLLVALFVGVGYLIFDHDKRSSDRVMRLTEAQERVVDEVSALTYVMTLTQEERLRLNISMPESLRKRTRADK